MKRRQFITLVGGAAAWPFVAWAQQPATRVVGLLSGRSHDDSRFVVDAFQQGVNDAAYASDKSIAFELRFADGDFSRLPSLARELVTRPVEVLATVGGTASALAAKSATTTIPIVFLTGDDPVKAGLVASLNRPSGNLTGASLSGTTLATKRVEMLRALAPHASSMAVLVNPTSPIAETQIADANGAAQTLGLTLRFVEASNDAELAPAFASMAQQGAAFVFVTQDAFYLSRRARLAALAAQHGIPATYESRDFADAGGLMSYGTDLVAMYRQIGLYTGRILTWMPTISGVDRMGPTIGNQSERIW